MTITEDILHKVWAVEQEILDVIHNICKKHNLKYSLAFGTLLGAIRHGGFIPWDDDIDIMMPREDYEKLKSIWKTEAPSDYIMMDIDTHGDITNTFMKVVKNNTTFLQCEKDKKASFHKGIFVDIFPGDLVAPKGIKRKIQYFACAVYLLYTRGYASGSTGFVGFAEKILLKLPKKFQLFLRKKASNLVQKWNYTDSKLIFFVDVIRDCKRYYPSNMFNDIIDVSFCGKKYNSISIYDQYLSTMYKKYMQLPPEADRVWKHHPLLIDFEHNYEDL